MINWQAYILSVITLCNGCFLLWLYLKVDGLCGNFNNKIKELDKEINSYREQIKGMKDDMKRYKEKKDYSERELFYLTIDVLSEESFLELKKEIEVQKEIEKDLREQKFELEFGMR